jgi:hypothetical protein
MSFVQRMKSVYNLVEFNHKQQSTEIDIVIVLYLWAEMSHDKSMLLMFR